jgi:hypothetical protein
LGEAMSMKKSMASVSVPDLHNHGTGVIHWKCQSHGALVSPKLPVPKRPRWLTTKSLSKRMYLSSSTGNIHGMKSEDYNSLCWSMPKMFGDEKYAFTLVDIEDPRYLEEVALMGRKLTRLNYEKQIIDMEWRKTYKMLLQAEHHLASFRESSALPSSVANKTKTLLDGKINAFKDYLLQLQEQKDSYETLTKEIYDRCNDIKKCVRHENNLEELSEEMTERVRSYYPASDEFWSLKFNARSSAMVESGDEFEQHIPGMSATH